MQPLKDIKVLSVTVFLAGPYLSMNLARMGAEVIKVEVPGKGDPVRGNGPFAGPLGLSLEPNTQDSLSTRFIKRSQGLKSITLDLKTPQGKEIFLKLAKEVDLIVENLSPGSMQRLNLGYEDIYKINENIIYCSISGYGQHGAYSNKPAHDPQIQGMSGLMDINGASDGPSTKVGFYIGDLVTPLFAAYSIMAALRHRDQTGEGQYLDVSMMDTLTSLIFMENLEEDIANGLDLRTGNNSRSGPTGLYHTQDSEIIITAASDAQWQRLCIALDASEFASDPRFSSYTSRIENVREARQIIQAQISNLTLSEAITRLESADVPCGPVRSVSDVMNDQQFYNRGTLIPLRNAAMSEPVPGIGSGWPVQFSSGPLPAMPGAPVLGMHNKEILTKILSYTTEQIAELESNGII
jgi:crotonobetainyl-CoA:carnitine CoA-transferase CaiB-like acyl-CoA transferase